MINWQSANIVICIVAATISFWLALYAWKRRDVRGAVWFAPLLLAVGWVLTWYIFEAAAGNDLDAYVTFSKFEYIGLTFIPLFWLGFALSLGGKERLFTPLLKLLLVIIPLVTILLAFTNDLHGLIWAVPAFDDRAFPPIYTPVYGVWFWVYTVYAYTVFLAGSAVLIRAAFGMWKLYRAQAALILIATAMPWISNLLEILDITPLPGLYLNAVFLSSCMVLFAFAIFRLRLLDVVPLAYESILNNVPDGLIVVDSRDRIIAFNAYVLPYLTHPEREPIGQTIYEAFPRFARPLEALRATSEYRDTYQLDDRVIEVRIAPVVDRGGKQRGRLFVFSDVTVRAQAEAAQMRLFERISKLERLKSEMIRIAAHDLKNPVSVIINYLDLLTDDSVPADILRMYGSMERSAKRMQQIIDDFLSLERIEHLAQEQIMQPFDLREVMQRAHGEFADRALRKAQQLQVTLPDQPVIVNGDDSQLYEAVANFVSNAIKYTPEGGQIHAAMTCEGDTVHVEVRDTGYGIPADMQERLFEPFYRVKTDETRAIEGTGLGLHLVKNIVERHNGKLMFESEYGKGSTFGFRLPLHKPEEVTRPALPIFTPERKVDGSTAKAAASS